mgnify:CR=1 FL=1
MYKREFRARTQHTRQINEATELKKSREISQKSVRDKIISATISTLTLNS